MNTMNDDENHPQPQPWIDPALEARIVAGVLGETSAFEAAELERAVEENPELAIFKRRITAVHDLVGSAVRPEKPRLQLSPERRGKLLATIGVSPAEPRKKVAAFKLPPPAWWTSSLLIRVAACFVIGAIFVTFFSSVVLVNSSSESPESWAFEGARPEFLRSDQEVPMEADSVQVSTAPMAAYAASDPRNLPTPAAKPTPLNFAMSATGSTAPRNETMPSAIAAAPAPLYLKEAESDKSEMAQLDEKYAQKAKRISALETAAEVNGSPVGQAAARAVALDSQIVSAGAMFQKPVDAPANASGVDAELREQSEAMKSFPLQSVGDRGAVAVVKREGGIVTGAAAPPPPVAAPAAATGEKMSVAAASQIKAFTGGWGKSSGAGTGVATDKNLSDTRFADAKPSEDWDNLYMYRGVNVLAKNESATRESVPVMGDIPLSGRVFRDEFKQNAPQARPTEELTASVINQPVFTSQNGAVEFDGFVHYGAPISTTTPAKALEKKQAELFPEAGKSLASDQDGDIASNEIRSQMLKSVEAGWSLPVRRYDVGNTSIIEQPKADTSGKAAINRKLDEIIIPKVEFKEATLREAVELLQQRAKALDPSKEGADKKGVDVLLNLPKDASGTEARVTLELTQIPLRFAIEAVAAAAGLKVKVEPNAVAVLPISDVSESLVTKEYTVPPNFAAANRSGAKASLEAQGVVFPPGTSATYLPSSNKLIVRNTASNLELVDNLIELKMSAPEPPPQSAEIQTTKQPFSTFSLHVSDASFQLAKDALAKGSVPDPARIRAEEFYNAFDYNDPAPAIGEPVAARIEQSAHPFRQQRDLVRIALKVAAAGRAAGQPLRLTILLDTSGSMEREDRAASVRRALKTLATLLGPQDRVTLIGFARTPRLLAEQVSGDQAGQLVKIADRTPSEGGTNLESALALASEMALKQKLPAAQNRIVLLTDGAANLGNADPARLAKQIESTRQQGISFDACGVGANGLNDGMLEALTRKGDGRYYFINRPEDADAGFARQLAGALRPAAENVKVQVVFNPSRVKQYRLIGFEKHLLKKEDFRNDKVQAAELSAEEAGIALYQVETLPEGEGELGQVFVRFRDPATGSMVERSWPMPYEAKPRAFDQASPSMQLAATAALLAEKLRGDSQVDLDALAPVIHNLRGHYPNQARVTELIQMVERLRVTKP